MNYETLKRKNRMRMWNTAVRIHLNSNTILSTPEVCRRANVHKSDMCKFLTGKKEFGAKVLLRIEAALEGTGYRTKDPRVKQFKATLKATKIKREANIFLNEHF